MDVRAAVAFAAGKPLEVTTVQLDGPKAGEVLIGQQTYHLVRHADQGAGAGFLPVQDAPRKEHR